MKEKIKEIVQRRVNSNCPDPIDWQEAEAEASEMMEKFLVSNMLIHNDWMHDACTLISINEAGRIINEIKESKWFSEIEEDALYNYKESVYQQEDPDAFYGVPYDWGT